MTATEDQGVTTARRFTWWQRIPFVRSTRETEAADDQSPTPAAPLRRSQPPKPPRRRPVARAPLPPLSPGQQYVRGSLVVLAVLMIALVLSITLLGQIRHYAAQQQLSDSFRQQLAEGIAPVAEGDFNDVLLPDGAPVALLEIPSIGVREVVVEGTDSEATQLGPGHRRDTVLPGQAGISVIMGRAAAYGGPFGRIQQLDPGETFTVITGQGEHDYEVIGLRYAGDPAPPALKGGEGRLVLVSARGLPYLPVATVRVDAKLVSDAQPTGLRQTRFATLDPAEKELQGDTSMVWALVFALQLLIVVEVAAVWSYRRIGPSRTWVVFVPVGLVSCLWVASEVSRLLPNLM
ncbi:sortase [Microbacterium schleiferi]|uniref:Sortase n=1 Tax=Microbacterium schleiferi TaxID=69362 RepID=A0ABU7V862_9MICO